MNATEAEVDRKALAHQAFRDADFLLGAASLNPNTVWESRMVAASELMRQLAAALSTLQVQTSEAVEPTALEVVRAMLRPDTLIRAVDIQLDGPRKDVFNALTYLARTGELTRVGYGLYQTPPAGPSLSQQIASDLRDGSFRGVTPTAPPPPASQADLREALPQHSEKLKAGLESAVKSIRSRPPELRGSFKSEPPNDA
jgi:hypothetical protein